MQINRCSYRWLLIFLLFAAGQSFGFTSGAGFSNTLASPQKGVSTLAQPVYMFNIYLASSSAWSYCNECNTEMISALTPMLGGTSSIPAGKYIVTMIVTMTEAEGIGRWVKLNGLRIYDSAVSTNAKPYAGSAAGATLVTSSNVFPLSQGYQFSSDGNYPYFFTFSNQAVITSTTVMKPMFGVGIYDSSHNENYWTYVGTVTFIPTT